MYQAPRERKRIDAKLLSPGCAQSLGENARTSSPPMIGKILGHYRVLQKLGAGGMGEVYLAHDERLEREVALKVLHVGALTDESARRRLRKEALTLSKLNHPNIETIHEFDTHEGIDFLVMEYVAGVTLSDRLTQGAMSGDELLDVARQLAEGLAAAHTRGVIHLDLKPGNVRVTPDGRLKILDFGLAKVLRPEAEVGMAMTETLTETQVVAGTLPYMAPEQLRGAAVDHRCDIWATGVVLYEMATGRRPFEGKLATAVAADIQTKPAEPPSRVGPSVSPGLERIILRCLEKDPDLRYQSARELIADFRRLETGAASDAVEPRPMAAATRNAFVRDVAQRWRRLPAWIPISVLVVVAGAVIARVAMERWRREGPAEPSRPVIASLAVLPLRNLSATREQDYLVEGLHEALITELSKISALRVISRTSTIRYRESERPLQQVARDLNVEAVVEGSVLRSGNRLRVSTQLILANPERHLWAQNFDRELTDVLYLTSDVAQAVARQIRVTLTPAEKVHLARARPIDSEAYELYAVGRHQWSQRTLDGYKQAIASFQKALDRDPGYAPVHAALADSYMLLGEQGGLPQNDARSLAEAAIRKAFELDENLAEAHSSLGQWKFYYGWNWAEAEAAFRRAIELNPSYAAAHQLYGRTLGFLGRFAEGLKELQRARELDPLSILVHAYIGQVYIFSRQYDRAAEHLEWTLTLNPNHALVRHNLAEVYLAQGRFANAVEQAKKSVELSREPSAHFVAILGGAYARANRKADALKTLEELKRQSEQGLVSEFDMASLFAAFGEEQTAMTRLEQGYAKRDLWLAEIKGWPWFDSLIPSPRFQVLLERLNFPK